MKIKEHTDIQNIFKVYDKIWACAFEYNSYKEGKFLHQKPVLGQFMAGNTLENHNRRMSRYKDKNNAVYFVPLKKNGIDLAWSKAVHITSRVYATTEEECIELYNELIQKNIDWHITEIEELKSLLVEK